MLNNFIYAKTKALFLKELEAGNVLDEAIVFIEDAKEIWNHGTYFSSSEKFINTTYSELKSLRDNSQLIPGSFYRITDYVTTTTQEKTKSANHPFDVIVLALSENTLCEDAKAALHEGDTYFADSDLSAWELKYCLDNDSTRFAWADKTNGKGVIYRMVDEKSNDCPYDFKNILFSGYYTFTYYGDVDASIAKSSRVRYNTIHCSGSSIRKVIFQIHLLESCRNNSVGAFSSGTFIGVSEYNTIGEHCSFKITNSSNNIIENECYEIEIEDFGYNIIKSYNKYLRVKSYQSVVEEHFNDKDYMINILKHGTTYTNSVQCGENFHDDGSGQVVPIKHPDLSTQPSILPYKFMGQYVYEQLIPVNKGDRAVKNEFAVETPMIMSAGIFSVNSFKNINILAAKSNTLLLDTASEMDGYINVKYTDSSVLSSSGGYYSSTSTSSSNNSSFDFGIMEDGTLYIYDNNTLTLSKNGELISASIPSQYKNSSKIIIDNNVTSIGKHAFSNCSSLTSVEIPNSVTSIEEEAFYNCSNLISVKIGNSVTSIGDYAFYGCSGLTSITCKAINPPGVGLRAFNGVSKSIPLYVPAESVEAYKSTNNWNAFTNIQAINE